MSCEKCVLLPTFLNITEYIFDRFGIRKTYLLKHVKCEFINN